MSPFPGFSLSVSDAFWCVLAFIMAANSHVTEPETKVETKCEVCGTRTRIRCIQCKAAYYCTADCQRKAFPVHKLICNKAPRQHIGEDGDFCGCISCHVTIQLGLTGPWKTRIMTKDADYLAPEHSIFVSRVIAMIESRDSKEHKEPYEDMPAATGDVNVTEDKAKVYAIYDATRSAPVGWHRHYREGRDRMVRNGSQDKDCLASDGCTLRWTTKKVK